MVSRPNLTHVEAAVPAAAQEFLQATRLPLQRSFRSRGFTLAELLITVGVLVLLILLFTQLLNSAASITTLGHKRMDADSQARQLLDRMALDFAQMVKRSDVDYYLKSSANPQPGNDQIAFLSLVPGYQPAATGAAQQSPVSLVAYRVNSANKFERMGMGLVWNGVSVPGAATVVFLPLTLSTISVAAVSGTTDSVYYERIAQRVFRFEYSYLLTDGTRSISPGNISGVAAVIVDIAALDPNSNVLINSSQISSLIAALDDYAAGWGPGVLLSRWQAKINNPGLITWGADGPPPRSALAGIRLYERYFYLSPPTL
jgi:hypothetical protein